MFLLYSVPVRAVVYAFSLHDALPIWRRSLECPAVARVASLILPYRPVLPRSAARSVEHTSELQSLRQLVYRLLLEKKKKHRRNRHDIQVQQTTCREKDAGYHVNENTH